MTILDCAIIGAGPAGLSAGLVLGRARKNVALFDNGTNRNRVTQKSHGFLTRDGIKPEEFKAIALNELKSYPSVEYHEKTVVDISRLTNGWFSIKVLEGEEYIAEKVVLATGIQEVFPQVPNIKEYYGKSLFNCPYCDGWELRDQPLIIISENEERALHLGKIVYNWSENLVIATNGHDISNTILAELERRHIRVITEPIQVLQGNEGYLNKVEFNSGQVVETTGGFVVPSFVRPNQFAQQLGCEIQESSAIVVDAFGRTTERNIYSVGENTQVGPSSLLIAAAEGNKVAVGVNMDITDERF